MTNPDETPTHGTGDGGALGTPTSDTKEAPPSSDQDQGMVVSGGDVADKGGEDSAV